MELPWSNYPLVGRAQSISDTVTSGDVPQPATNGTHSAPGAVSLFPGLNLAPRLEAKYLRWLRRMKLEHRPEWLLAFRAGYSARGSDHTPSSDRARAKWFAKQNSK